MDWSYYRNDPRLRSEVFLGRRMVELNGESSFFHFFVARMALVPVCLLGGWCCFLWARDLFGETAGVISLALWTFSPNILAYGSVIAPDLASTVGLIGCTYVFWRWLRETSWSWTLALTAATACAALSKSIWIFLPPLFVAIWLFSSLVFAVSAPQTRRTLFERIQWPHLAKLTVTCFGVFFAINAFYGFAGSLRKLGEYRFVSARLTGHSPYVIAKEDQSSPSPSADLGDSAATPPEPVPQLGSSSVDQTSQGVGECCLEAIPENRFAETFLGTLPLPLPENFMIGLDIQNRDFERGAYDPGWQSYLFGEWKQLGWYHYYLVAYLVKVPLPVWLLLGVSSIAATQWRPSRNRLLGVLCLWFPALAFFACASLCIGMNRFIRYALPALPFLFVWASYVGRLIEAKDAPRSRGWRWLAVVSVAWLSLVSICNTPNHLSYFNEIAGGPSQGYQVLADANVDWGQDLGLVRDWVDEHPEARETLHLGYCGCIDPVWVGLDYEVPPPLNSSPSLLNRSEIRGPKPGWHVISKNLVVGQPMPIPSGTGDVRFLYSQPGAYQYFSDAKPVDEIGHSMLVYRLNLAQANSLRAQHGLALLRPRFSKGETIQ
ncbi:MAG: glycosyltransferase family 39 protein [Planctomycetota bacterium]